VAGGLGQDGVELFLLRSREQRVNCLGPPGLLLHAGHSSRMKGAYGIPHGLRGTPYLLGNLGRPMSRRTGQENLAAPQGKRPTRPASSFQGLAFLRRHRTNQKWWLHKGEYGPFASSHNISFGNALGP
jgi:hypothetical protein